MLASLYFAYYNWLIDKVCDDYQAEEYDGMLQVLYSTEFTWSVPRDANRASDGLDLRDKFLSDTNHLYSRTRLDKSVGTECTVLEMMVALAVRCENTIMGDYQLGDRTGKWFWTMIDNLKLGGMAGENLNLRYVHERLDIFLSRKYCRDGSDGALFTVKRPREDLRKVEIWYQLNWYLTSEAFENEEKTE